MEASDRNSERNHEYHDYPAFYIEERERTVAGFFLLFNPATLMDRSLVFGIPQVCSRVF